MLLYDPVSGLLSTGDGSPLKRLSCPLGAGRSDLIRRGGDTVCRFCDRTIVALDGMDDAAVADLFARAPDQCVSFDLNSPNIRVVKNVHGAPLA